MPYTASVLHRAAGTWVGADADLNDLNDLDALADMLREAGEGADLTVLFVEEDDEYLAVVRVDGDGEPRVFVSDRRALTGTGVAGRLLAETEIPPEPPDAEDDDEDEDSRRPELEPAGEVGLLADLGTDADRLADLCAEEGMLPSDVIFAVCERAGCGEVLEEVRGL